ncbi:MAG TPA: UbiD family decarboxylase [Syntrophales bacterium]|nr:UbiD family decarboxylase [Syntrophales bacterium]
MKAKLIDQKGAIDFCTKEGELLTISKEVDPLYEIAGISKSFDGGPTVLFENIKGYPKWKAVTNIFANRDRVGKYFGTTKQGLPTRILDAARNPVQPKLVTQATSQENVITKDIDILNFLPVITHTKLDIGPVISGGVVMINVPQAMGGGKESFNLSFHRMNPSLGKDWVSMATLYSRHFLEVLYYHKAKREEYPVTINIGMSPALNVVAAGGDFPQIRPIGTDDLGMAGNLEGQAVEYVKAKTVDAYALAHADVVLEGKVIYNEKITEELPSKAKGPGKTYFFPEQLGYEGLAAAGFKIQVSAITYRNNPCYFTPLADAYETNNLQVLISEASIYNACKSSAPNIFRNCHVLDCMKGHMGVVIQCRVPHEQEQGISQNLINAAFGSVRNLNFVIAVDEDVDIYDPSDVMWAVVRRTRAAEDVNIIKGAGIGNNFAKWSVDTTVPVAEKHRALRPQFEPMDLGKWLTPEEIAKGLSLMDDGARSIARRRV